MLIGGQDYKLHVKIAAKRIISIYYYPVAVNVVYVTVVFHPGFIVLIQYKPGSIGLHVVVAIAKGKTGVGENRFIVNLCIDPVAQNQ